MITQKIWESCAQSEYALMRIPGIILTSRGTLIIYNEARKSADDWAEMNILARRSEDGGKSFSSPQVLAHGTAAHPTVNNPVMAEDTRGTLHFHYCESYGTHGGRILHRTSTDDGKTWGSPKDITAATMPAYRNVFAPGPGHGICTKNGALAFPFWLVPKKFGKPESSHFPSEVGVLYSLDFGITWKASPLLSAQKDIVSPNETVAAELEDGKLYLAVRQNAQTRAFAILKSNFSEFEKYASDPSLADPICFGSVATFGEKLLFLNCDHSEKRKNVTLKESCDGESWQTLAIIDKERGGYADLAADTANGKIYVLYENDYGKELYLATLDANEI